MQKQHKKHKDEYAIFKMNSGSIPDILFASQRLYDPLEALNMYANAFYDAAEIYFKEIVKGLDRKNRWAEDRIFPALFLFRHSVELYLKSMIMQSLKVNNPSIVFSSPSINKLFEKHELDFIYGRLKETWPVQNEEPLSEDGKNILNQLIEIDNKGEAFRYPFNCEFKNILPPGFETNSVDVWVKLEKLGRELSGRLDGLVYWANENISYRTKYEG